MAIVNQSFETALEELPNFLKKDLEKFMNIIFSEIKRSLKRGERVELRGFGVFSSKIQKARISRIQKQTKKSIRKKTINFKMSKDLFKISNNEKIKYLLLVIAPVFLR